MIHSCKWKSISTALYSIYKSKDLNKIETVKSIKALFAPAFGKKVMFLKTISSNTTNREAGASCHSKHISTILSQKSKMNQFSLRVVLGVGFKPSLLDICAV